MSNASPTTNPEPRKPNGISVNGASATEASASAPAANAGATNGAAKPAPSAKELARRQKVSKSLKAANARKRDSKVTPTPAGDLDTLLEQALEPALRRVVGRVIGKLLKEAIGS